MLQDNDEQRLLQPTNPFQYVLSTKSLGPLSPCPCEKKAASIANKTFFALNERNISDIYYRFLQSKKGQRSTLIEVIFFSFLALACLVSAVIFVTLKIFDQNNKMLPLQIFLGIASLINGLHVPPNIANTLRYRMLKNNCERWLSENANLEQFSRIKDLKLNNLGLFKLCEEIRGGNLPAPSSERLRAMMESAAAV